MNEAEAERIVREALLVAGHDCRFCGYFERHQNCQDRDCALRFAALDALDFLVAQALAPEGVVIRFGTRAARRPRPSVGELVPTP